MYSQHFNFSAPPFSIAPNPRYVYLSQQHQEALAHLLFGVNQGGGFVVLTGEVGTGKTTLCRCLLEQLPEDVEIALIFNPRLNSRELLAGICDELRIPYPQQRTSLKLLIDLLNRHLLDVHARGMRTVVLIDEAQNLSFDVLEQIRLLTNLETNDTKLLQIILVGQPELNDLLRRRNLRQLAQRVTARYHLRPLSYRETEAYISHRIAVSGVKQEVFSAAAIAKIHRLSGGIPRLINLICDRALLGAYARGKTAVARGIVGKAAAEVLPAITARRFMALQLGAAALVAAALLAGYAYLPMSPKRVWDAMPWKAAPVQARMGADVKPPEISAVKAQTQAVPVRSDKVSTVETASMTVPPAIPAPSFAALAADPNLTRKAAFDRLFNLWGLPDPDSGDECAAARRNALHCLSQRGSWVQLRNLEIPAILAFEFDDRSKYFAVFAGMYGEKARLLLGERSYDFAPADILPYWRGDAVLLWRPPVNGRLVIKPGDRGAAVKWLRNRLGGAAAEQQDAPYDAKLQTLVADFQKQQGLFPDGVAGALTLIHLSRNNETAAVSGPPTTSD